MKKYLFIILAVLFSVSVTAQQRYDLDFTQTKVIKISGKTTPKAGHLTFDGNDHLTMNYTEPEGDYFIIEGTMVKLNMDGKKAELDANKVKIVQLQRSTLLNCLSGNWEQAAADNNAETQVSYEGDTQTVTLTAKGKVPRGGYASVVLTYRNSDGALTKMVLEEAVGAVNTYEMDKKTEKN